MDTLMHKRANRGAELLDQVRPHWYMEINLDTLNLSSHAECVLGQVYGDYGDGINVILDTVDHTWDVSVSSAHGFNLVVAIPNEIARDEITRQTYINEAYAPLNTAWRELVLARLHMDDIKELAA